MVVADANGRIVQVNRQAVAMFGYTRAQLVGAPIEQLLPERFRADHVAHRDAFLAAARTRSMGEGRPLFGRTADGSELPVEVSLSPVTVGDETYVCSAIRDSSAHREAQRLLEAAKELAEEAAQTKSRFLAAASHDLRQPLQSITLYLGALARMLDDESAQAVVGKINGSIDVMSELLDALLDVARFEGDAVKAEIDDVDLRRLLQRIADNNRPQAQEKGLTLRVEDSDAVVRSDPALLERIVENFVSNAIRYTEEGDVTLRARDDHGAVRIEVADTGIGMPEDAIDKVFDEYYQLGNTGRDRRKGLGLGLSIVKRIARTLGHPLHVNSQLGRGSTFAVTVPFVGRASHVGESAPVVTAAPAAERAVVLLVDDDPAIVDATMLLLEGSGVNVHGAMDGDEALALLANGVRPDLLVSDYRLPGYNGVELVRRVQAQGYPDLPVVLMTGDTSAQEIPRREPSQLHGAAQTRRHRTVCCR